MVRIQINKDQSEKMSDNLHICYREEIKELCIKQSKFFIGHVSYCYPLSEILIDKFLDKWNWWSLGSNKALPWSLDFIKKYIDYWQTDENFIGFSEFIFSNPKLPCSIELIHTCKNKINWDWYSQQTELQLKYPEIMEEEKDRLEWYYISGNEKLTWTDEFINQFENFWDWEVLSGNRGINWTKQLQNKYKTRFCMEKYLEGNDENWFDLLSSSNGIDSYLKHNEIRSTPYTKKEFEIMLNNPDWKKMSRDKNIPWSLGLIEYFKDDWYWKYLSCNTSLPWSELLIDKYIEKWDWGSLVPDGDKYLHEPGLSGNEGLPWTKELIKRYSEKWFWNELSISSAIPWSLDLINEFYDKWNWNYLFANTAFIDKVIGPLIDDYFVDELMTIISEPNSK